MNKTLSAVTLFALSAVLMANQVKETDPMSELEYPSPFSKQKTPIIANVKGSVVDSYDGWSWYLSPKSSVRGTISNLMIFIGNYTKIIPDPKKSDFRLTVLGGNGSFQQAGMPSGEPFEAYSEWVETEVSTRGTQTIHITVFDSLCLVNASVTSRPSLNPKAEAEKLVRKAFSEVHRLLRITGAGESRRVVRW